MEPDMVTSQKPLVIYNIYSPEGNYFWRGENKSQFWGKIHQIQLSKGCQLHF